MLSSIVQNIHTNAGTFVLRCPRNATKYTKKWHISGDEDKSTCLWKCIFCTTKKILSVSKTPIINDINKECDYDKK